MKSSAASFVLMVTVFLTFLLALLTACSKEYSYEQVPADTADVVIPLPDVPVSFCPSCNDADIPDSSWRINIDGVLYCGKAEKSIVSPEKTGFTFFGPSFCSADSGFVVTVYLQNESLTSDKVNLQARMGCYYYDQVGPSYVYMSAASQPIPCIITRYEHQTGKASGTFSGVVLDKNGVKRQLKDGRFRVQF